MVESTSHFHRDSQHLHRPFGGDRFGRRAESFARFFGTPRFLIGQTILVMMWIAINVVAVSQRWDPYPFILLNLAFSLQAAYAAPLILLAQTRQADRDKGLNESDRLHRESLSQTTLDRQAVALRQAEELRDLSEVNARYTEQILRLTTEVHRLVVGQSA